MRRRPEILPFKRWQALLKLILLLDYVYSTTKWQIPLQDRKTPLSIRFELQNSDSIILLTAYLDPFPFNKQEKRGPTPSVLLAYACIRTGSVPLQQMWPWPAAGWSPEIPSSYYKRPLQSTFLNTKIGHQDSLPQTSRNAAHSCAHMATLMLANSQSHCSLGHEPNAGVIFATSALTSHPDITPSKQGCP